MKGKLKIKIHEERESERKDYEDSSLMLLCPIYIPIFFVSYKTHTHSMLKMNKNNNAT